MARRSLLRAGPGGRHVMMAAEVHPEPSREGDHLAGGPLVVTGLRIPVLHDSTPFAGRLHCLDASAARSWVLQPLRDVRDIYGYDPGGRPHRQRRRSGSKRHAPSSSTGTRARTTGLRYVPRSRETSVAADRLPRRGSTSRSTSPAYTVSSLRLDRSRLATLRANIKRSARPELPARGVGALEFDNLDAAGFPPSA